MASAKEKYLQKYLSKDAQETKKKRRKKKKSGTEGGGAVAKKRLPVSRIVDVDDDWRAYAPEKGNAEDSEGDEETPVVVDEHEVNKALGKEREKRNRSNRGSWQTINDQSDDDGDTSPPRRKRLDSDDDASPPRRRRLDSDDDASPPRRKRLDSDDDASPPRRKRLDSDDDASPPRRKRLDSDDDASPPRRKRLDSDDDASPPRRKRLDSDDDASPPLRKRLDSDDDASPPRRKRLDSDDDASPPRRKRAASDDDASPPRRKRKTEESGDAAETAAAIAEMNSKKEEPKKMSSGHSAGLLKGAQFGKELRAIKRKQREEEQAMGEEEMGKGAETIIRDKKGRRLDMLEEMMRQQRIREGKEEKQVRDEYEWGTGTVQKAEKQKLADEFAEVANAPFARYANDPKLEAMLKNRVRSDDPMAAYMSKKKTKAGRRKGQRPVYKGPSGPINRFGIRPGYRWDGNDRGSLFEEKLMKSLNEKSARKNDYAAWSAADM